MGWDGSNKRIWFYGSKDYYDIHYNTSHVRAAQCRTVPYHTDLAGRPRNQNQREQR